MGQPRVSRLADLAVAIGGNGAHSTLNIYLGNGDGTFATGATYTFPGNLMRIAAADLNGDGKLDLALADSNSSVGLPSAVSVMLGNGDGTFSAAAGYGFAVSPAGVVVGDFNGDGKLDVAVTDQFTNEVRILPGNGDGTFQESVEYAAGGGPDGIAVGDFKGDGKIDLATANFLTNDASILLGHGDGTFNGARAYAFTPTAAAPSIATGDLNHDGNLDVVVQGPSVLLGNGDGTLQAAMFVSVSNATQGVALADFNNDGNLDVAVPTLINSGIGNQFVAVMLGNGDGTFQPEAVFGSGLLGPQYLVAGDFNGDGNLDLVTLSGSTIRLP